MRKNGLTVSITALAFALMFFSGCKKEDPVDETNPVITLNGDNPMTLLLGTAYTEPGATATDDTDGNISSDITISGTVEDKVGTYSVTYSVSDAAGNSASAIRTVNVVADRSSYVGTWSQSNDCPTPYYFQASSPTFSAGTAADKIEISLFYYNGGMLTITVDGTTATVDAGQSPNPQGVSVTGSGTLSTDGTTLVMDYIFDGTISCTSTYTKQ